MTKREGNIPAEPAVQMYWLCTADHPEGTAEEPSRSWRGLGFDTDQNGNPTTHTGGDTIYRAAVRDPRITDFYDLLAYYIGDGEPFASWYDNESRCEIFSEWLITSCGLPEAGVEEAMEEAILAASDDYDTPTKTMIEIEEEL